MRFASVGFFLRPNPSYGRTPGKILATIFPSVTAVTTAARKGATKILSSTHMEIQSCLDLMITIRQVTSTSYHRASIPSWNSMHVGAEPSGSRVIIPVWIVRRIGMVRNRQRSWPAGVTSRAPSRVARRSDSVLQDCTPNSRVRFGALAPSIKRGEMRWP